MWENTTPAAGSPRWMGGDRAVKREGWGLRGWCRGRLWACWTDSGSLGPRLCWLPGWGPPAADAAASPGSPAGCCATAALSVPDMTSDSPEKGREEEKKRQREKERMKERKKERKKERMCWCVHTHTHIISTIRAGSIAPNFPVTTNWLQMASMK